MANYGTAKYGSSVFGSDVQHPYAGTPGKIMWMLRIDWDKDGIFGGTIESQRLISVKIVRGRKRRMNENADAQLHPEQERVEIRLFDPTGVLDSFNVSSPLYQHAIASGLLLRVLMVSTSFKEGIKPVFVGALTNLEYDSQAKSASLPCGM